MGCKTLLPLMFMVITLMTSMAYAQDTRMIEGEILSEGSNPVPGLAVIQLGTDNAVVTDLDGKFKLVVESTEQVFVHVFGLDLEIYLKYEEGETSKTASLENWKQLKKNNKRISNEWASKHRK